MRIRLFIITLFIALTTLGASAQEPYILSWVQGDLDGDRVPERVIVVSPDSPDPTSTTSKKELRVLKRKGDKYVLVYKMPIDARFSTNLAQWQYEDPATRPWGLSYEPAQRGRKASVMVCFVSNSGEFFHLVFDGKSYRAESSGD